MHVQPYVMPAEYQLQMITLLQVFGQTTGEYYFLKQTVRSRFVNILHYLVRFDEKSNRLERLKTVKFSFFSIV